MSELDREKLVELMARAMCSALTGNESAYDNPRNYERESFQMEATAALAALEASGVRLVPERITPQMAWCLESNFAAPLPASEIHAANWQEAYCAARTSPAGASRASRAMLMSCWNSPIRNPHAPRRSNLPGPSKQKARPTLAESLMRDGPAFRPLRAGGG